MKLTDKVEIWSNSAPAKDRDGNPVAGDYGYVTTVPANLSYQRVEKEATPGRVDLIEELRAIIEPYDFNPSTMRLMWDGRMFFTDGPPMARRRNGKTHHLTIPLKFV